jgi:fatty-acyl-CoA synthase
LNKRVRKQANVFKKLGLNGGQTIAVLDYDSHRYLECFFGKKLLFVVVAACWE